MQIAQDQEGRSPLHRHLIEACILLFTLWVNPGFASDQQNLILITIDTLRADHLSYNGSTRVKTPNLDALAAKGANFQRVRSAVPLTLPSHASILTALYPPSHGVRDNATFKLRENVTTLAEVLKTRGYQTAAFVGSFVLDHRFGLNQGFDVYDDRAWNDSKMLERLEAERNAGAVKDAAVQWLRTNAGKRPFFLWIHFYDPHAPYTPPEPFRSRYGADPYAGEVAYTDFIFGELQQELKAWDPANTIMAIIGDHGEGLGEHHESTHSVLIYNSTLHVPMFIVAPGKIVPGRQVRELCRTIDLAPTLLDYLGIRKTFGEGVSLRDWIDGKPHQDLTAYSESFYPKLNLGWSALSGLETTNHHYIESPQPELFEIRKDPSERINRIKQFPAVALRHRQHLQQSASSSANRDEDADPLDPETREKLAALGYISGSAAPKTSGGPAVDPKEKIGVWNQIQMALYHITRSDHAPAIRLLKNILQTEKQIPLVYDYLAGTYMQMEDWDNAEQVYRQALKTGMESSTMHANLGLIHLHKKQYSEAGRELEIAIAMDRSNVLAHYNLANVYRAQEDFQKAIEHYEIALKINPDFVFAWNGAGMAHAALKQDDRALEAFQRAVRIDPANAPAYFNLAIQMERMKRVKEAIEIYRKFLKISNDREFALQRKRAMEAIRRLQ